MAIRYRRLNQVTCDDSVHESELERAENYVNSEYVSTYH